jgi:hypothetical protein
MSYLNYKQNDIILSYKSEFSIILADNSENLENNFDFINLPNELKSDIEINKNNGTILIKPTLKVGIYNLTVSLVSLNNRQETSVKVTIKPVIYYKGYSFYFNEVEKIQIQPKVVPEYLVTSNNLHYKLEEEITGVLIDSNTGIITFNNNVDARNYKLVIISIVEGIEVKSIVSFNIYPSIDYCIKDNSIYIDHWTKYTSPQPIIKPCGGDFMILNEIIGITIDNKTGIFSINESKAGLQSVVITYKINNIALTVNLSLYVKPILSFNKLIVDYGNFVSTDIPFISEYGGKFDIDKNFKYIKSLSITQKNGVVKINDFIPSGYYKIDITYEINNYKTTSFFEIQVNPHFYYVNKQKEIIYGFKESSEEPFLDEEHDGIFTILNPIPNVYINPKNGIIYFDIIIDVGEYNFEINYNKNNINKINNFILIVKPYVSILEDKQSININNYLKDVIINISPSDGYLSNNLKIPLEGNILCLSKFNNKIIGNFNLDIFYTYNNIKNNIVYNFDINPIIEYTINRRKIFYGSKFISESPNVEPENGVFSILDNDFFEINSKTGQIILNKNINIANYEIIIYYEINGIKAKTTYFLEIYPYIHYNTNSYDVIHGEETIIPAPKFLPINGTFECEEFKMNSVGNIIIPSDLDVNKYIINVSYSFNFIKTKLNFLINVLPCKLNIVYNTCEKIYDGTQLVKVKYNSPHKLLYDAIFIDSNVGKNKKIFISNIKVNSEKSENYVIDDIIIRGHIHPKMIDITFIPDEKIYNNNKNINVKWTSPNPINIKSFKAILKNASVGKQTVIISNIIIDNPNYTCNTSYEVEAIVKPKELLMYFESIPQFYIINSTNVKLKLINVDGYYSTDNVVLDNYNANFEDSNIGTNKVININNIKLKGKDAFNYTAKSENIYGTILPSIYEYTANVVEKIYDGSTKAEIIFEESKLFEIISYDAEFSDKNVGNNKTVIISNIKISNNNFILENKILKGNIIQKIINVNITGKDKIYNENNIIESVYEFDNNSVFIEDIIDLEYSCLLKNINADVNKDFYVNNLKIIGRDKYNYKIGKINLNKITVYKQKIQIDFYSIDKVYDSKEDAIVRYKEHKLSKVKSFKAEFYDKNVGTNKKIKITNIELDNKNNYYIEDTIIYGNILHRTLNLLLSINTKNYDGTTKAEAVFNGIKGICSNDNIYISDYNANFTDYNVGTKTVNINNILLGGIDADNYNIIQPIKVQGTIEKKELFIEFYNIKKLYDTNLDINLKYNTTNILSTDDVKIKFINPKFTTSNIGNNKEITINKIILEGLHANNYKINKYKCIGTIEPSEINLEFICSDKIYDGTNNVIVKPNYNLNIKYEATINDINVGSNKKVKIKILENLEENYILKDEYETIANILPQEININVNEIIKNYDNISDTIVKFDTSLNIISYNAYFEDKTIGINKNVFINNIICSNNNYKIKNIITKGTIKPKYLNPTIVVQTKEYDGTTNAIIKEIKFDDNINIRLLSYDAHFENPNIGDNKVFIKNIKLSNPNYIISDTYVNCTILQKNIKIKCIIDIKEYDGTTTGTINNIVVPYNLSIDSIDVNFEQKNITTKCKVYVSNIKFKNKNYTCDDFILYGSIKPRLLLLEFNNVDKIYDKNTNTNISIKSIQRLIKDEGSGTDSVIIDFTSKYKDYFTPKNKILITNIKISNPNYIINNFEIDAKILPFKLEYNLKGFNKFYNGNYDASVSITLTNILDGDHVIIESYKSSFDSEYVGYDKKITVHNIILGGRNKYNYYIDNYLYTYATIFSN